MPETRSRNGLSADTGPGRDRAGQGVFAIRRSLGLEDADEATIRAAGLRLRPHVDRWVDAFMTRLLTDPVAMQLIDDDARVIRAKRSLTAWFHELFSLPYDEHYERLRERIGHVHYDLGMPPYLIMTAMSGVRRDMLASVRALWGQEAPEEGRAVARALTLALDMELALIVSSFRRRERTLDHQYDRAVYGERAASHFLHILFDRIDSALCYLELARRRPEEREASLAKIRDLLRAMAQFDHRMGERGLIRGATARRVRLAEIFSRAIADVSLDASTRVDVAVQPADLEATVVPSAVHRAVEELLQNAATHGPGGLIRLRCRRADPDGVVLEITDEGPGWGADVHDVHDLIHRGRGIGLSYCELVAERHHGQIQLFRCEDGGAGVRLELRELEIAAGGTTS